MSAKAANGASPARFRWKQRLELALISTLGHWLISLIGRTLRYEVSSEEGGVPAGEYPPDFVIGPFWHRCVIPATWYFRKRGIAVMTSQSYDGEYIARIIERFGFIAVRGSSSRGGSAALRGMNRALEEGHIAAFTIDGPRGPRYVAKFGPVALAKSSMAPILCFYLAVERPWILRSWDRMMIPRPFSKVHLRWARQIRLPQDADEAAMKACYDEMQAALERVRHAAVAELGEGAS
ncbi:MAG: lysophospholipid acyltransferase family protein [Acidobacteriota bacterium]|nr:lysophospholipid acyltransferase family protein [Acidobacteriota bacterium]